MKAGTHLAVAKSWKQVVSMKKGTEGIEVLFEVVDGVDRGQTVKWTGWLTANTEDRTYESLFHCGWTGEDFPKLPGLGSKQVSLEVEDEVYEGKTRQKVAWVNAPGAVRQADPGALNKFAARAEAFARALAAKDRGAANGMTKPKPPPEDMFGGGAMDSDEIPF
jgi:hypothetical protein